MTSNVGPATKPPKTAVPPAMPSPPEASEPPPKKASVAFVAAAPLRELIAVPVEATANVEAALYAPNAANAPPVSPANDPPASERPKCSDAPAFSKEALSMRSLLSSSRPVDSVKSTFLSFANASTKGRRLPDRTCTFSLPKFSNASPHWRRSSSKCTAACTILSSVLLLIFFVVL